MKRLFLLTVFLLGALATWAQPYNVGHIQITYNDPARSNRAIQTELYYPATTAGESTPMVNGQFPVIVFGHGFVMVWSAYSNIWDNLAPQGYILAFPRTEGNISPNHGEFGADLAFLVSKLQSEGATNSSSIFYNHVNTKSAIMGHSMGGGSSFLAAANNTNITTMISFAAANTNPSSIAAAQQISVPSLVISGQNDCVARPTQHQIPMYDSLASACKAYVEILGGGHCYFAETNFNCSAGEGTCTPNPTITRLEQQDATQDFAGMWLAYYLKDDCTAWTNFQDSLQNSARVATQFACTQQTPTITQSGNQLQSTPASTYQWYLNGNPINGAMAQTYTPLQNGNYTVEVTYSTLCPVGSNTINWLSTGIANFIVDEHLVVYPNPANDECVLQFTSLKDAVVTITITDLRGSLVLERRVRAAAGVPVQHLLNLSGIESGMYQINLQSESVLVTRKLIKQ
ncbi:MAG: T9SS type A sorting domain-containing protein [Bacteroidia bacterium]